MPLFEPVTNFALGRSTRNQSLDQIADSMAATGQTLELIFGAAADSDHNRRLINHIVGIDPANPIAGGMAEGILAGRREVVTPGKVEDTVGVPARHGFGSVGRAGVHDHDLVHRTGQTGQAGTQCLLFVFDDQRN